MILQILFDQIQGYIQSSINSSFHSKFFVCLKKNEHNLFMYNFWMKWKCHKLYTHIHTF